MDLVECYNILQHCFGSRVEVWRCLDFRKPWNAMDLRPGMLKDANDRLALMQKLQRDPTQGSRFCYVAREGAKLASEAYLKHM
jgi:hypothetical protein